LAVSRALERLLAIRELEEEQSRLALESALGELNRLKSELEATDARDRRGRQLVVTSARSGELPDRLAGLVETRTAVHQSRIIAALIKHCEIVVGELRQGFLFKRIERRQAETLIDETKAQDAVTSSRRGQQELDNWYQSRLVRTKEKTEHAKKFRSESGCAGSTPGKEVDLDPT
jgi:flagellar biosynthesis chaperone FliJ